MIAQTLAALCFTLAVGAWLMAVIAAVGMVNHREKGRSVLSFVTSGMAFFSGKGFSPAAAPYQRRFRIAAGCFVVFVVLGIGIIPVDLLRIISV